MKKALIGYGGFGREVFWSLTSEERKNTIFFVDDKYFDGVDPLVLPLSKRVYPLHQTQLFPFTSPWP